VPDPPSTAPETRFLELFGLIWGLFDPSDLQHPPQNASKKESSDLLGGVVSQFIRYIRGRKHFQPPSAQASGRGMHSLFGLIAACLSVRKKLRDDEHARTPRLLWYAKAFQAAWIDCSSTILELFKHCVYVLFGRIVFDMVNSRRNRNVFKARSSLESLA
jgi:hypothetical protein